MHNGKALRFTENVLKRAQSPVTFLDRLHPPPHPTGLTEVHCFVDQTKTKDNREKLPVQQRKPHADKNTRQQTNICARVKATGCETSWAADELS